MYTDTKKSASSRTSATCAASNIAGFAYDGGDGRFEHTTIPSLPHALASPQIAEVRDATIQHSQYVLNPLAVRSLPDVNRTKRATRAVLVPPRQIGRHRDLDGVPEASD